MKLTEAKLKQMILEALKKKYDARHIDLGIPSADERLRSKIGDETFDKIQSLDPEQALITKQSLDDTYPYRTKQETIESFMKSHGFKLRFKEIEEFDQDYIKESYIRNNELLTITYSIIYRATFNHGLGTSSRGRDSIKYRIDYLDTISKQTKSHKGEIDVLHQFEYDLANEEDASSVSTHIISDQRKNLEKIIGVSK